MKVTCWYKNGSKEALYQFCNQNQDRQIFIKLVDRSEPIKGALYSHCHSSPGREGLFILLTERVTHPAYYGLDCIESLHIGIDEALSSWAYNEYLSDRLTSAIKSSGYLNPRLA